MNEKTRNPILEVDQIEKLRAVYHIFRAVENAEREEPDEVPTEHPDQEHADAYYADQI